MKIVITLILLAAILMGGVWVFKSFMAQPKEKPGQTVQQAAATGAKAEPAQAAAPETKAEPAAPPARSAANPGDLNLSTAGTPVAKSKMGRKINHIYSEHNKGLDKAAAE